RRQRRQAGPPRAITAPVPPRTIGDRETGLMALASPQVTNALTDEMQPKLGRSVPRETGPEPLVLLAPEADP
ncbi:MAG: hypothetical protein C4320_09205, partial [Armatimonadota bacterium]